MARKENNNEEKETKKRSNNKKRNTSLAAGIFILGILVIVILFMVMWPTIANNLARTNFFERIGMNTPEIVKEYQVSDQAANDESSIITNDSELIIQIEPEKSTILTSEIKKEDSVTVVKDQIESEVKKTEEEPKIIEKTEDKTPTISIENKQPVKDVEEKTPVVSTVVYTDLSLCFISMDSDGSILRKMVKRSVQKNDSPLTTAIMLLIDGPDTSKSAESSCLSLIPSGTKLLSARVQDGIAYLNFNEAFEINPEGVEGYYYSLMQIVYTATSFSTVKSVQFLIEGAKKDFLSDGQWIGSPLSRASF